MPKITEVIQSVNGCKKASSAKEVAKMLHVSLPWVYQNLPLSERCSSKIGGKKKKHYAMPKNDFKKWINNEDNQDKLVCLWIKRGL